MVDHRHLTAYEFIKELQTGGKPIGWWSTIHAKTSRGFRTKTMAKNPSLETYCEVMKKAPTTHCDFYTPIAVPKEKLQPLAKKAGRGDISHSHYLWCDVDLPKVKKLGEAEEWRSDVIRKAETEILSPSIIAYSGLGIWLFWRLDRPCEDIEKLEKANSIVSTWLYGDPATKNADRVCRLFGYASRKERFGNNSWTTGWRYGKADVAWIEIPTGEGSVLAPPSRQEVVRKTEAATYDIDDIILIGPRTSTKWISPPTHHFAKPVIQKDWSAPLPGKKAEPSHYRRRDGKPGSQEKKLAWFRKRWKEGEPLSSTEDWSEGARNNTAVRLSADLIRNEMPKHEIKHIIGTKMRDSGMSEYETYNMMKWIDNKLHG